MEALRNCGLESVCVGNIGRTSVYNTEYSSVPLNSVVLM
jgi:hypothetical protein